MSNDNTSNDNTSNDNTFVWQTNANTNTDDEHKSGQSVFDQVDNVSDLPSINWGEIFRVIRSQSQSNVGRVSTPVSIPTLSTIDEDEKEEKKLDDATILRLNCHTITFR